MEVYQSWWLVTALSGFIIGVSMQIATILFRRVVPNQKISLGIMLGGISTMSFCLLLAFAMLQIDAMSEQELSALMIRLGLVLPIFVFVYDFFVWIIRRSKSNNNDDS